MCMAIPSRVTSVDGMIVKVESFGIEREASLLLMEEEVRVGDYVILMAGGFVMEIMAEDMALEALAFMRDNVLDQPDVASIAS